MTIRLFWGLFFVMLSKLVWAQSNGYFGVIGSATSYYTQGKYERAIEVAKSYNLNELRRSDKKRKVLNKIICQSALEIGKRRFRDGKLNEIEPLVSNCLTERYDESVKRKIYALLTETEVFLDNSQKADDTYLALLKLDPFSELDLVTPEMLYMANRFETFPLTAYTIYGNLFFSTRPIVSESFALPEVEKVSETYKLKQGDLYSWSTGFLFDVNILNSNLYFRTGYGLNSYYYRYNGTYNNALDEGETRGEALVTFQERSRWSQIPLILKLTFVNRNTMIKRRLLPYAYAGVGLEFLHEGSAQLISPTITFLKDDRAKSIPTVDNADNRINFNTTFLSGIGTSWRFRRSYVYAELVYQRQLMDIVERSNASSGSDLRDILNYVDNDFRLHKFGVGVGFGFFLFKSQKIPGTT